MFTLNDFLESRSLRTSVQLVHDDLHDFEAKTRLHEIIKAKGGKYRRHGDAQDTIMFNVYTNVTFSSLRPDSDRGGLVVKLSFDSPPGRARSISSRARTMFWEGLSGKRMMQGGLVALIWKSGQNVDVHLGILASSVQDLIDSAKASQNRLFVRVAFFDPAVELRILHLLRRHSALDDHDTILLLEAPVMFEAIRPFLEALRVEPEYVPFPQYLVHQPPGFFSSFELKPPQYARIPGFSYQLASLFPMDADVEDLKLDPNDPSSIACARRKLRCSRLDESQADALVDVLTREVALVQGYVAHHLDVFYRPFITPISPPGTGKVS